MRFLAIPAFLLGLVAMAPAQAHIGNGMEPIRLDDPVPVARPVAQQASRRAAVPVCWVETQRGATSSVRAAVRQVCR